jgi:hypothetical protein
VGSTPPYQRLVLPRVGAVPPNSAVVVDAHVVGPSSKLGVTAHVGEHALEISVELAPRFSSDRFGGGGARYLVRPTTAEWPRLSTVRLTITNGSNAAVHLDVPIGDSPDLAAPTFSSMSAPTLLPFSRPGLATEVTGIAHGPFDDPASPLVLVDAATGRATHRFAVAEGQGGTLLLDVEDNTEHVDAITLTDLAGNARRIEVPCGPPLLLLPFTCVAGSLERGSEPDSFIATSDASTDGGFSRGHYLWREIVDGDIEVSVRAERLGDEHEMPVEIAFRGGFFAVTGTSSWFLYESDRNWTGWQPTPVPVDNGSLVLRVVQRGRHVTGYVGDRVAGTFTLSAEQARAVGIAFKARPGRPGRIKIRDFWCATQRQPDGPAAGGATKWLSVR